LELDEFEVYVKEAFFLTPEIYRDNTELDELDIQIVYRLVARIKAKEKKGLELDEFEEHSKRTLRDLAEMIVAKKKHDIELTRTESRTLDLLRRMAKNKKIEELETQILSTPVARIMSVSIDEEANIKDILSKTSEYKIGTNLSIIKVDYNLYIYDSKMRTKAPEHSKIDERKLFINDSKIMTKVLEYKDTGEICLSSSGNTLVVREGIRLDIWNLCAKTAQFIGDIYDVIKVHCCDDQYIAYSSEFSVMNLKLYAIATKQEQTLGQECYPAQIFKGSLYYGKNDDTLTVAKLDDIKATQVNRGPIYSITASDDVVIAQYFNGFVEAWKKDFEVEWSFEAHNQYQFVRVIGDKAILTSGSNEAVIHDLKSHSTTTVIDKGIGNIYTRYEEIEPSKVTLNISEVHNLKTPCLYWLSLILGLLYYVDVVTDFVLLGTYFSSELYLLFALSLVLIITPNIVEVVQSKHRTLKTSLAQLLFVDHLLALRRDFWNPTYMQGKRTTGYELSKRTTIETCIESMPQSLISLYFIFSTENYTAVPLVSLAMSMLSASIATSFGLKLGKPTAFEACLLCYRLCEILVRVMILALCSTYIYPYFAILFVASSTVVHFLGYPVYLLYVEDREWKQHMKEHWFYYLTSSAINSFSYVNGIKDNPIKFITKGDDGASLYHLIGSSIVNIVLIFILLVEVSWAAFMFALIGIQLTLYALLLCDEAHRVYVSKYGLGVVDGAGRIFKLLREINQHDEDFYDDFYENWVN
jgi:hypothetical protein